MNATVAKRDRGQAREQDRVALPQSMRRDVRLLGDILGEIIRDSGGPELLAEVDRLRRNLRERDTGHEPVRESLAAAVAEISREAGPEHLRELLASLRVHLVLTAHPTEARRRAVVAALRRISGLLDVLDDPRTAAASDSRTGSPPVSRSRRLRMR